MSTTFVNLGRRRGEFEGPTKKLIRAHAGVKHPKDLGFIAQADLADRMCAAMVKCNGLPKEGRLQQGVPDDKWARSVLANPLRKLKPEQLWIFLPERRELSIIGGHVVPKVDGQTLPFGHPELFAALGQGYRLIVCFDPGEPTLGAAILNNEAPDSTKNSEGWKIGEVLGLADYMGFAHQFASHASFTPTLEYRKKYHNFVAAEYRATGLYGQGAGKASSMRDGAGRVAEVQRSNGSAPAGADPIVRTRPVAKRATTPFEPATPEEFQRGQSRREKLLAAQRASAPEALVHG